MTKEITKEETIEIFKQLPKIIQDAITKSGWEVTLRNIVNRYGLRIDQGAQLESMTLGLMMGQISSQEYYDSIRGDFELGEDKSTSLFQDIDDEIFGKIGDIIQKLELDQSREKFDEQIPKKENFVKDSVESASMEDEILTVTRDEILRGIEEPEKIQMPNKDLPDLKNSNVMPPSNNVQNFETPKKQNVELENKEVEIPSNLPANNNQNKGPVNPVEAGLNSSISTSTKDYKGSDPYREPIE